MDCLGDANPDVEEADAGEEAADGSVAQQGGEGGMVEDDGVVLPDAIQPGENGDEHADVETEDDEDDERRALQPDGRRGAQAGGGRSRWLGLGGHRLGEVSHSGRRWMHASRWAGRPEMQGLRCGQEGTDDLGNRKTLWVLRLRIAQSAMPRSG